MKYLKTYEGHILNLLTSDQLDTIRDILLDLSDDGFSALINNKPSGRGYYYITIDRPVKNFEYSEVEEVVDRLKNYIGDRILSILVFAITNKPNRYRLSTQEWINLDDFKNSKIHDSELKGVSIRLK